MRQETITTNIYTFEELSETAKESARDWYREASMYDEWWDFTYEDAEIIGLKITGFDLYRHDIEGEFISGSEETAHNIIKDHGNSRETYTTAENYLSERGKVIDEDENGEWVDDYVIDEQLDDLDNEFLYSLLEDYRIMLNKEYEYLQSDEYVDETIIINEYEFTEDGSIY